MQTEVDHIVVGGGSAGCAVAARLAEQPKSQMLVIKACPSDQGIRVNQANAWLDRVASNTDNWTCQTVAMQDVCNRKTTALRVITATTNAPSMMIGWQIGGHIAAAHREKATA